MRKIIRNIMRAEAKRDGRKPSRWIKVAFDTYQNRKYGTKVRQANQAKGTHKKYLWGSRVAMFATR